MSVSINGKPKFVLPEKFVPIVLPWVVGGAGLLIYLITLDKWVSLYSIGTVARVSGWDWRPELSQPLTFLLLYPSRWLPDSWIPLALNCFAAFCGGLVLVLLARSVALLRHDLTPDDPLFKSKPVSVLSTPTAWIPPVLAGIVCGLQLSFWEHATSFSGEMVDLLVFAYVIRCLLEFRVSQNESWLSWCALVYAAGMANNWALIGYLPIFLAALLWITSFGIIYNKRLVLRMALYGSAGLSLYLLLPALRHFSSPAEFDFWAALKANLRHQKEGLSLLLRPAFRVLALTSLLPMLVLSIRWKSHTVQSGDDSRLGVFLTKATGHLVHGLFFVISLWIALDPTFSPRNLNLGMPMLTYYYLSSLVAGYCAGYFLLFGTGRAVQPESPRRMPPWLGRWKRAATAGTFAAVWILLGLLPLALVSRNLWQLKLTNGPAVREFARHLYADLPVGKSAVLSDDPDQLFLLRAELAAHEQGHLQAGVPAGRKDALLLDTRALASARYQRFMANRFGSRWPPEIPANGVKRAGPRRFLELISEFAARETLVYLQPVFGPSGEVFLDQPKGLIHLLELRTGNESPPEAGNPPKPELVQINERIWQKRWIETLQVLSEHTKEKPEYAPSWAQTLLSRLQLPPAQNLTASALGAVYAKAMNYWGVQMQRLGRWEHAGVWFRRAVELNPENLAALINLQYNEQCRHGDKRRLEGEALQKRFHDFSSKYDDWLEMLTVNGPVDEPTVLFKIASALLAARNNYQAAREFARCAELAPDWLEPRVWLALSYIDLGEFGKALELVDRIQATGAPQDGTGVSELLLCRTTALRGLGRTNEAAACVESFVKQYRERGEVLSIAADIYAQNLQFEGALTVLDELLKNEPDNVQVLATKGWAELELSRYNAAIETLSRVVSHAPSDENARLNLAIARLSAGQLDAARADYQELLKTTSKSGNALFGLGGIAWRKHETNTAIGFYEQYLAKGSPGSPRYLVASERLKHLRGERAQPVEDRR